MIPAASPIIPSAAITTTGTAPAFVDVGVGVTRCGDRCGCNNRCQRDHLCRYRAGAAARKTDRCIPGVIAGSIQLNQVISRADAGDGKRGFALVQGIKIDKGIRGI